MILFLADTILSEIYEYLPSWDLLVHQRTSKKYQEALLGIIQARYRDASNQILIDTDNHMKRGELYSHHNETIRRILQDGINFQTAMPRPSPLQKLVIHYYIMKYGPRHGLAFEPNKYNQWITEIMEKLGWPAANWNMSRCRNLSLTFLNCTYFNEDISDWDVSNVNYMVCMFAFCEHFNQDLSSWETGNCERFSGMFLGASQFTAQYFKMCLVLTTLTTCLRTVNSSIKIYPIGTQD